MSSVIADLKLPATPERPFTLTAHLLTNYLIAMAIVNHCVIASASGEGELAESLALGPVLQVGTARFKLLPEEVEIVRDFLARFPSPALPSSSAAHEATSAADLPSDGACGTAPPAAGSAGGSLEAMP